MHDIHFSCFRKYALQDGVKKFFEAVLSADNLRPANPAANEGESGENHERNGHGPRRFVDMFLDVLVGAAITEERKEEHAEHIKRGESRGNEADNPQQEKAVEGPAKDFILAEKTGEGKNSGNRQSGDQHGVVSELDLLVEAAHFADVLLAGHGVDNAARAEEQEGFEEGVGHKVKNSGGEGAYTEGEEHVTELADGGIGENFLDVGLDEGHGGGKNGGGGAYDGDDVHGDRRELVNGVHPHDHVDAGGHHGGGVDQRADWGRAFHGVGEPDVERDLGGFAHGADEEQECDGGQDGRAVAQGVRVNGGLERLQDSGRA